MVVVAHDDGTMASYGHLSKGIEVAVDGTVEVGQLLGWSGRTGFAGRPHLHFHVGLRMVGEPGRTIPIKLRGEEREARGPDRGGGDPAGRRGPERTF